MYHICFKYGSKLQCYIQMRWRWRWFYLVSSGFVVFHAGVGIWLNAQYILRFTFLLCFTLDCSTLVFTCVDIIYLVRKFYNSLPLFRKEFIQMRNVFTLLRVLRSFKICPSVHFELFSSCVMFSITHLFMFTNSNILATVDL